MRYLVKNRGKGKLKSRAHIWLDFDTACRMYSTSGMAKGSYDVQDELGDHQICHMCRINAAKEGHWEWTI